MNARKGAQWTEDGSLSANLSLIDCCTIFIVTGTDKHEKLIWIEGTRRRCGERRFEMLLVRGAL